MPILTSLGGMTSSPTSIHITNVMSDDWIPASKRGQSQARLNYAEQEQGKADFSRVNL